MTEHALKLVEHTDPSTEPAANESQTAAAMQELSLFAVRPGEDEPDYRPLPELQMCRDALERMAGDIVDMFVDTRLEDAAETVLWGLVHIFHRKLMRVERDLDRNVSAQQRSQREQDFSEVKDLELQRLVAEGHTLHEQQNAFTALREIAAELFEQQTGSVWTPPAGARVAQTPTTASILDSRKFIAERKRQKRAHAAPDGEVILFSAGDTYQDVDAIWSLMDKVREKYPDMIVAHTAFDKGGDMIVKKWAARRGVPQVPCRPDFANFPKHVAPFKRIDEMLTMDPVGVVIFPGSGVTMNLRDKARARGLIVLECTE